MRNFEFSEAEKETFKHERYYHPHPHVRRKMETLWLKSQVLPHAEICRLADISEPTLCDYLVQYETGRLERLKQLNFYQPESELMAHTELLKTHFQEHPPATIKEAMANIETFTVGPFVKT